MERYHYSDEVRAALESMKQAMAVYQVIDGQVVTLLISDGFRKLFGYPDREQAVFFMDHNMYKNIHPDDRTRLTEAALRFADSKDDDELEVVYRTKAGMTSDYKVIHLHGHHQRTETGVRIAQIFYMDEGIWAEGEDTSAQMNLSLNSAMQEDGALQPSHYDDLTGLSTQTWFFKLGEVWRARARSEGKNATLLYMDFNGMKLFNQKYGFAEGDRLLKAFSDNLARIFGKENCCHVAADHFSAFSTDDALEAQLQELFGAVESLNGGRTMPLRVGIYSTAIEDVSVSYAYDRAKMACRALPKSDFSASNYYSKELLNAVRRQQHIVANIDRAIAEGWIKVYYQPIVRAVNEKICDEEALARWIDPEEGFLSPGEFIPYLEDAGLIYKLDLCVLDQVLEKLWAQKEAGVDMMPHSVNLSRSDFAACDIVEEIRKRVDAAGISHDKISIEITESTLGSDFEFMKEQIARFRELGFPVWIDDFGSGYSSFDILLSIPFDLVKLDMSFMRKLDENEGTKIILTELIKSTTSLGIDTICEGVETESQVRFLQEIGCSKLQGFYFSKPLPLEQIIQRYNAGLTIGFEDSKTAAYFETIGRVNLYDLEVIASREENNFQNAFNMLPMGVIEITGDTARFVRSNPAYRDFMRRYFNLDISNFKASDKYRTGFTRNLVKTCCEQGTRAFYNETMPDGSVVHSFARRIAVNPQTGSTAVVVAVLSISEPGEGETYADIARALAADYYNIYIVDLDTDEYIEYTSSAGEDELSLQRRGKDFFTSSVRDTMKRIYEDDQKLFLTWFTKEKIVRELDEQGVFTITYRLVDTGTPVYVNMKINRMRGTNRIILGISVVDSQMKQQVQMENAMRERSVLAQMMAISGNYLSLYSVDPKTNHYIEFTASPEFEQLGIAKEGADFFRNSEENTRNLIHPDDLTMFLSDFSKEKVMEAIQKEEKYTLAYRLLLNGEIQPIFLKVVPFHDGKTEKLLASVRKWRNRT